MAAGPDLSARGSAGPSAPRQALPVPSREAEQLAIPDAYLQAAHDNELLFRGRLPALGVRPRPNDGANANLCAIISLLQLAGTPDDSAAVEARQVCETLMQRDDPLGQALRQGQGLYADPLYFRPLAEHVFADRPLPRFVVMTVGASGEALLFDPLQGVGGPGVDPQCVPPSAAVMMDWGGHIEAMTHDGGQPWPQVLSQLSKPPKPDHADSDKALIEAHRDPRQEEDAGGQACR